jgi:hypothetical protein
MSPSQRRAFNASNPIGDGTGGLDDSRHGVDIQKMAQQKQSFQKTGLQGKPSGEFVDFSDSDQPQSVKSNAKAAKKNVSLNRAKGKGGAYERISAAVLNHPNAPPGFKGGQKDVDELSRALGLQPGVDYRNWATLGKAILNALNSASPEKDPLGQQVRQSVQNLKGTPAPKGSGTGVARRTGSGGPAEHPISKYGTKGI